MLEPRPVKHSSCFHGSLIHPLRPRSPLQRANTSKSSLNAIETSSDLNLDFVTFTLIVDDLVFWDGTSKMGQLGGGGAQTAWGYQSVTSFNCDKGGYQRAVGLAAGVGSDVPSTCLQWLENIGVDVGGIQQHPDAKTSRAWQILEQDGRRHEVGNDTLKNNTVVNSYAILSS
jgi:hypothetical protein